MQALQKVEVGPGLTLTEVPAPTPAPDEVVIEVSHAAICGTDLHIYRWDDWAANEVTPPTTIGHEFVGRVVATGSQVSGLVVGTRVAGEGHVTCGRCRNCRAGNGHLCRRTVGIGIHRDGGFADLVAIPAVNAYAVPDLITDEVAAILDPLGNAVHTALSFDLVGEDVLVTGAGPIGQIAAAVARHAGARNIVVTDVAAGRLDGARAMGATRAIPPGTASIRATMEELDIVEGFDVALEMSGRAEALVDIFETINHGGKVALLGLHSGSVEVDLNQAVLKGLTIKGVYGRELFDTWYKATTLLQSGLDVAPVISHRFQLEDFEEAFDVLEQGEASKVVLAVS